jgi:hypothetical protein
VADMFTASLSNSSGLVVRYDFSADNIKKGTPGANGIARVIIPTLCDVSCVWWGWCNTYGCSAFCALHCNFLHLAAMARAVV